MSGQSPSERETLDNSGYSSWDETMMLGDAAEPVDWGEREPCPACGGSGIGGVVSREMAIDACMPGIEGQEIPCGFCNGDGWT